MDPCITLSRGAAQVSCLGCSPAGWKVPRAWVPSAALKLKGLAAAPTRRLPVQASAAQPGSQPGDQGEPQEIKLLPLLPGGGALPLLPLAPGQPLFGFPSAAMQHEAAGKAGDSPLPSGALLSAAGPAPSALQPMTESHARGIILRAAMGTGWTTTTGLEGPSLEPHYPSPRARHSPSTSTPVGEDGGALLPLEGSDNISSSSGSSSSGGVSSWPELTSSPRRTARVKFTCKRCGARTMRAINPHAYGEGTVFVQCGGCLVFHKLVDNLNLFHELQGSVFHGADAGARGFGVHESVDILGLEGRVYPPLPLD